MTRYITRDNEGRCDPATPRIIFPINCSSNALIEIIRVLYPYREEIGYHSWLVVMRKYKRPTCMIQTCRDDVSRVYIERSAIDRWNDRYFAVEDVLLVNEYGKCKRIDFPLSLLYDLPMDRNEFIYKITNSMVLYNLGLLTFIIDYNYNSASHTIFRLSYNEINGEVPDEFIPFIAKTRPPMRNVPHPIVAIDRYSHVYYDEMHTKMIQYLISHEEYIRKELGLEPMMERYDGDFEFVNDMDH